MNNAILAGAITLGAAATAWAAPKATQATSSLATAAFSGLKNLTSAFKSISTNHAPLVQATQSLRLSDITATSQKSNKALSPRIAATKEFFDNGAKEFNLKPRAFTPEIQTGSVSRLISQWEGHAQKH